MHDKHASINSYMEHSKGRGAPFLEYQVCSSFPRLEIRVSRFSNGPTLSYLGWRG